MPSKAWFVLFILLAILAGLIIFVKYFKESTPVAEISTKEDLTLPEDMAGFYASGVEATFYRPDFALNIKAREMYLGEGKVLFFKTRLFKRLILNDIYLKVFKNDKKILEITRKRLEIDPNWKRVTIRKPFKIIYLKNDISADIIYKITVNLSKDEVLLLNRQNKVISRW